MRIFVERPIATAMIFLALLVLGVYSFMNIPLERAPREEYPRITVYTMWPNVSPEIIQAQITSPLEEKSSMVGGIKKMTSSSGSGVSEIYLEFEEDTNMEFARLSLREKIAEIKDDLPEGINGPHLIPFVPEEFEDTPLLKLTISGEYSLHQLRDMVKDKLEMGIGSVKGISQVEVTGGSDPQIKIILDEDKMRALQIPPYLIISRLGDRTRTYPAGRATKGSQEYIFKFSHPIADLDDIGDTIIMYSGSKAIKLSDIAEILPSYEDVPVINRINGQPTLSLTVHKERGTSTPSVAREVNRKLEAIKLDLPSDLVYRIVDDQNEEIQENLHDLYLLVAIIVTVIFLLIFLVLRSFKPSLLVLSSIGFSVLITFNLIYLFKVSINMLTLGGIALGFGLFVDNSIVVFENVLRLKEQGKKPVEAAIEGARQVFMPVLAATLTTMSVFFSFAYFQGRMKIYYLPLAIVISSALAASLLVSFSLIPAMSPGFLRRGFPKKKERLRDTYEKFLKIVLKHPLIILLLIAGIFIASYRWFRNEVTIGEWFGWDPGQQLYVGVGMPQGTPIERTDEVIGKFEQKVMEKSYEKEMDTSIRPERATIRIKFPPEIEYSYYPYILKEELIQLATNFAGISVSVSGFDPQGYYSSFGSGTYYDSRIKFFGYNLKKLSEITSNLEKMLKRNPRIKEVRIVSSRYAWWRLDSFEYVLRVDRDAIKKFEIDPAYLFSYIATLLQGRVSDSIKTKISGKELEMSIKFPEAEEIDLKELQNSMIQTRGGELLRVGDITKLEERPIAGSIDREDQQYQQTIMWEFRGPTKAAEKYKKGIYEKLVLPPGFSATLEDYGFWMTEEEKGQMLFAIIFSLIIIFMILAALYESIIQPFYILMAVPLALIGVFAAFVIADFPFDSSAYIGVILLGGIVVNNSILLVDHINLKRREGLSIREAVIKGARERIRPIFLTTATTVLGMLPLVLIQIEAEKRQIWSTLALSAVGGLISSTIFILIVIPIFYIYGDKVRLWFFSKIEEQKAAWRKIRGIPLEK